MAGRKHDPAIRIRQVLHGLAFPAAKWQLITHADYYGADARSMGELWELPVRTFTRLDDVIAAVLAGRLPRQRAVASTTFAGRRAPAPR